MNGVDFSDSESVPGVSHVAHFSHISSGRVRVCQDQVCMRLGCQRSGCVRIRVCQCQGVPGSDLYEIRMSEVRVKGNQFEF